LYYIREGYYNSAVKVINNGLKLYINDPMLKFYFSLASILQGYYKKKYIYIIRNLIILSQKDKNHEAVRDLESLKTREDVGLGSMLALVYTHKKFSSVGNFNVILLCIIYLFI
jgi:hypothetical protein